jgi:UDP-glucose 4-epimerase
MSKNICIIGGCGFLGTSLRAKFAKQGYAVIVIGRRLNPILYSEEVYYSVEEYTLNKIADLYADKTFDAILDMSYSTVPGTSFTNPVNDFSKNLGMILSHLDFSVRLKPKKYIYLSSGGTVYGNAGKLPIAETASNNPLSPYGISKLSCEKYIQMYTAIHGVNGIILRPSNIYGPGQMPNTGQGFISTALSSIYQSKAVTLYGDGTNVRDYLYIDDLVNAVELIINLGRVGEIYNIGSGVGVSLNEILIYLNDIVREDNRYVQVEYKAPRRFDLECNILDSKKINLLTDWRPRVDLIQGIANTWKWIKNTVPDHL